MKTGRRTEIPRVDPHVNPRPAAFVRSRSCSALGFSAGATQGLGHRLWLRAAEVTRGPAATGTLNAVIPVQVGSQVSGQIKELGANYNSLVQRGQIVDRIDPEIFEAQMNQAHAAAQEADLQYE